MIETYDALCMKEPWLELVLLGVKWLETRTKLMRKREGDVVLTSSTKVDEVAWEDPRVGGLLDAVGRQRALDGRGKLRGLVRMGPFHEGVPGAQDRGARIGILLPCGSSRFVSSVSEPRRLVEAVTQRVRPDGSLRFGASQGFFRVPSSIVEFRRD